MHLSSQVTLCLLLFKRRREVRERISSMWLFFFAVIKKKTNILLVSLFNFQLIISFCSFFVYLLNSWLTTKPSSFIPFSFMVLWKKNLVANLDFPCEMYLYPESCDECYIQVWISFSCTTWTQHDPRTRLSPNITAQIWCQVLYFNHFCLSIFINFCVFLA